MSVQHKIEWIEPYYDIILNMVPRDCKSILDVGAGSGIFGFILKKTRGAHVSAIEPFDYNLAHYDKVYNAKWGNCIINDNYDCIVSSEMIEHMTHDEACVFLEDVKRFGSKVIIVTPYHFEQQPAYDDNPYQVHKSVITQMDFEKYGYQVKLIGTISLRGMVMRFLIHPKLKLIMSLLGGKITNVVGVYEDKSKA